MGDSYRFKRIHKVELNGGATTFYSYNKPGFWLESDAIHAAKEAGLYKHDRDCYKLLLDGQLIRQEFK